VLRGQGSKANEFLSFYSCALLPMAPARAALLKQWRKGDRLSRFFITTCVTFIVWLVFVTATRQQIPN